MGVNFDVFTLISAPENGRSLSRSCRFYPYKRHEWYTEPKAAIDGTRYIFQYLLFRRRTSTNHDVAILLPLATCEDKFTSFFLYNRTSYAVQGLKCVPRIFSHLTTNLILWRIHIYKWRPGHGHGDTTTKPGLQEILPSEIIIWEESYRGLLRGIISAFICKRKPQSEIGVPAEYMKQYSLNQLVRWSEENGLSGKVTDPKVQHR